MSKASRLNREREKLGGEVKRLSNVLHLVTDLQVQLQEKIDIDNEKKKTLNDLEELIKERVETLEEKLERIEEDERINRIIEGCC